MARYQILETNILSAFKFENLNTEENNPIRIDELVDFFNLYWKNYQDKWTQKYWEVYESMHNYNSKKYTESDEKKYNIANANNANNIESKIDEGKLIRNNDSYNDSISNSHLPTATTATGNNNNYFKNIYSGNNNNCDENVNKNDMNCKDNFRCNSTNLQTKTLINLQDIDDELDKINELSLIQEKAVKPEKRRYCLDCNIF